MTFYIPTSTASTTIDVDMAAGDSVYVAPNVVLTDSTPGYYAIYDRVGARPKSMARSPPRRR